MASTVRNLTVDEAFKIALKITSEYSVRGNLQTGTKIADNDLKKFSFADSAQQEISLVMPIEGTHQISHFKTKTMFGDNAGLNIIKHINDDVVLMEAVGALSYVLKSNSNSGTFTIEEETSEDVWVQLGAAVSYSSANNEFVFYTGHITAGDTSNSIRIVLKGDYPYQVTNYTMYEVTFNGDAEIPEYGEDILYPLPNDFREMRAVTLNSIATNNFVEKDGFIILDKDEEGIYDITYHKIPKVIDDTSGDSYEFEIRKEAQHLIPFYIAGLMIAEDKPEIANIAFQEYSRKLDLLFVEKPKNKPARVLNSLWGVKQYDTN